MLFNNGTNATVEVGDREAQFVANLFWATIVSTTSIVLQVSAGVLVFALRIVTPAVNQKFSAFSVWFLLPIFLAHNLGSVIKLDILQEAGMWKLPLFGVFLILLQFAVGSAMFPPCIYEDWGRRFCRRLLRCGRGDNSSSDDPLDQMGATSSTVDTRVESSVQLEHLKKNPPLPTHVFISSIAYNNWMVIPYAYLQTYGQSDLFRDPAAGDLGQAYISVFFLPHFISFFMVCAIYFRVDPVVLWKQQIENLSHPISDSLSNETETPPTTLSKRAKAKKYFCICWRYFGLASVLLIGIVIGLIVGSVDALGDFFYRAPPYPIFGVLWSVMGAFAAVLLPVSFVVNGVNIGIALFGEKLYPELYGKKEEGEIEGEGEGENEEEEWYDNPDHFVVVEEEIVEYLIEEDENEIVSSSEEVEENEKNEEKKEKEKKEWGKMSSKEKFCCVLKGCWCLKFTSPSIILRILIGKLFIAPLICFLLTIFWLAVYPDFFVSNKLYLPVFCAVICIEAASPMSFGLNIFSALFQVGIKEMANILVAQYVTFPLFMVPWCVVFLYTFCSFEKEACLI